MPGQALKTTRRPLLKRGPLIYFMILAIFMQGGWMPLMISANFRDYRRTLWWALALCWAGMILTVIFWCLLWRWIKRAEEVADRPHPGAG